MAGPWSLFFGRDGRNPHPDRSQRFRKIDHCHPGTHNAPPHPRGRPSKYRNPWLALSGNPWIWPKVWRYKNVSVAPYHGSRIWWMLHTHLETWNWEVHTNFFEPPLAITKHGTRSRYKFNSSLQCIANKYDVNDSLSASTWLVKSTKNQRRFWTFFIAEKESE